MERTAMTKLTAEELKGYTKEDMIALVMQMQERLLAFIVAFAALLFPQQGQCNTTLCQLTVNVRIVRVQRTSTLVLVREEHPIRIGIGNVVINRPLYGMLVHFS